MASVLSLILGLILLISCQPRDKAEVSGTNNLGIIGGEAAAPNEFPFIVNIWLSSKEEMFEGSLCGGSLIDKKWVLTAAHCVLKDTSDKTIGHLKLNELQLFLGSNHRTGKGGKAYKAKSILVHPKFAWPKHDVALIELTEEIKNITPVNLSEADLGNSSKPTLATIAGWGLMDRNGEFEPEELQKVEVLLTDRDSCSQDALVQKRKWTIQSDTLCTLSSLGENTNCPGDSGGPLVQFANDQYTLIGIVSWGFSCREKSQLGTSNVSGFSDVSDARAWILSVIKN